MNLTKGLNLSYLLFDFLAHFGRFLSLLIKFCFLVFGWFFFNSLVCDKVKLFLLEFFSPPSPPFQAVHCLRSLLISLPVQSWNFRPHVRPNLSLSPLLSPLRYLLPTYRPALSQAFPYHLHPQLVLKSDEQIPSFLF